MENDDFSRGVAYLLTTAEQLLLLAETEGFASNSRGMIYLKWFILETGPNALVNARDWRGSVHE